MLVAKNAHSFNIGNYAKDKQNIRKRIKSNHLSSFSFYFICFVLQNMQIHKSFTFFAIVVNDDPCFHFLWTVKRFKLSMRKGQKMREKNFCTLTSYKFSDTPSKPIKNKLTKHFFLSWAKWFIWWDERRLRNFLTSDKLLPAPLHIHYTVEHLSDCQNKFNIMSSSSLMSHIICLWNLHKICIIW